MIRAAERRVDASRFWLHSRTAVGYPDYSTAIRDRGFLRTLGASNEEPARMLT
jgi:hypothetical protein